MSSLQTDSFAKRLVRAQEDLKQLKAAQIIGGDNMGYFEYSLPDMEYSLNPYRALGDNYSGGALFAFDCESPFPLVSFEMQIYENGIYRPNPYVTNGLPYGASGDSYCTYSFLAQENIVATYWETEVVFDIAGKQLSTNNPNNYIYLVSFVNRSSESVNVEFRNIKIRASHKGVVFGDWGGYYY